jgi:uncharacterized protein with HEPN domain
MPRDYRLYLEDILDAIDRIQVYTQGASFDTLQNNSMLQDAILHNLEIIGEAAKHVPDDLKIKSSEVEWRKIAGMRDVIAHEYFGISLEIVWDILQNKLPDLRSTVITSLEEDK